MTSRSVGGKYETSLYNTDVNGAVLAGIDLSGADVFNTAISVGGEY